MLTDIAWIALATLALPLVLGIPLTYLNAKIPRRTEFRIVPTGSDAFGWMPPPDALTLGLQRIGFRHLCFLETEDERNITAELFNFPGPVTAMIVRTSANGAKADVVALRTRFLDGSIIDTSNSRIPATFNKLPYVEEHRCRMDDLADILSTHLEAVESRSQWTTPIDPMTIDPVATLAREEAAVVEYQVATGLLRDVGDFHAYRYSFRGAARSVFRVWRAFWLGLLAKLIFWTRAPAAPSRPNA